jgi:hypothetical protein
MSTCEMKSTVLVGKREMELGGNLGFLRDSNDILNDVTALRERMKEDGYLLIRGLHNREQVLTARRQMLEKLAENNALDPQAPLMDGVINKDAKSKFFGGTNRLTSCPGFQELVKAPPVMGFFEKFLGGPARTFDYKWLRVVGKGDFTGAHYDIVYMGRGTQNLYTCWTPIGDVSYDMGPLTLCVGSHKSEFAKLQQTYGKMDVDRDHVQGWYSGDPNEVVERFGGKWHTAEFKAGDALIFGMYTLHMSLTHNSNKFRISSDTRYQLASEPVDERWIGEKPLAHYSWNTPGKTVTMEEARKKWGV